MSFETYGEGPNWSTWFAGEGLDASAAERGVRFAPQDADHAIDAAISGAGVVLGRRFLAYADLLAGRLVSPFGPVLPMFVNYYALCEAGAQSRADIAAFMEWVSDESRNASLELPAASELA